MAVSWASSFEVQQKDADGIITIGSASYSTTQARTGVRSMRLNPGSGSTGYIAPSSGANFAGVAFGIYIASLPSVTRLLVGQTSDWGLALTSTGGIEYRGATGTVLGTSSDLSTGAWHWIAAIFGGSLTGADLLRIDSVTAVTGDTTGSVAAGRIGFSNTEASAVDVYIDDAVSDGSAQTMFDPSKCDVALPISDNTRTAVTTGAGGTTNLWDAVNNTPPAGVASGSETATSNIVYPASLTEDYIANLETYTTLGVGASDTVLAVQSIVRHGEDIGTGTKNFQNVGALTNPTVAGATATAGNNAGAHGAEAGLWFTTLGTFTASPTVTLGTSPTIQTSRTSESRVACIDFMGMLVVWTPAVASLTADQMAGLLQPDSPDAQIAEVA